MSEMVERVAMALAADIEEGFPRFARQRWDDMTELARQAMRQRARIAITAMREPTLGMLEASWRVTVAAPVDSRMACLLAKPKDAHMHKMLERYRAAIDAAVDGSALTGA